jgi:NAD(P)-dependent dehydrogenase (short-subunit alcohol dehydrogenase family)
MTSLKGKVALVTGASRGVGKGVALGLGEAGATVYITGRTVVEGQGAVPLPGTIQQTAEEVTALGGRGIALRCDHRDDEQVRAVFARIAEEQGRLDVLVNNVWGATTSGEGMSSTTTARSSGWRRASGRRRSRAGTRCSRPACAPTTSPARWPPRSWWRSAPG